MRENQDREDRIVEKSVGSISTGLILAVCDLLERFAPRFVVCGHDRNSPVRRSTSKTWPQALHLRVFFIRPVPEPTPVVDLKLVGSSGLECVKILHRRDKDMKIVVLTGLASIATAVEAIKLGACHYLAKPSNADDIEAAFGRREGDSSVAPSPRHSSIKTLEWERIHETLAETDFNVSEAARRLGMHRRTLARKLAKRRMT